MIGFPTRELHILGYRTTVEVVFRLFYGCGICLVAYSFPLDLFVPSRSRADSQEIAQWRSTCSSCPLAFVVSQPLSLFHICSISDTVELCENVGRWLLSMLIVQDSQLDEICSQAGLGRSRHVTREAKNSVRKLQASSLMKSSAVLKIMAPVTRSVSRGNVGESSASALL